MSDRVAIVTGSARNIGRAIAVRLARTGTAVIVNGRTSRTDADSVVEEIRATGGQAAVHMADVTDPAAVEGLIGAAIEQFGRLDVLVNNASVRREVDFDDLDYREWRTILASTLDAAYLCCHAALPHLKGSGSGAIVNIGGLSSFTGAARRAHVIAAKAGLVGFTRALAYDLAPHHVTVNCVAPGWINTVRASGKEPAHHAEHKTLAGRRGAPEDVAALVGFLCGPDARYITGQTIHANGGAFLP